ncbi:unnamed protein product [Pleuronectes platessa]|uniref:Secreted protein n=1 Tax=Pleuronectes platessa TaxID=8262 RepID=A0A9N7TQ42_PLEPL|nr:unnamed protein product [Pleuronectes platessa]
MYKWQASVPSLRFVLFAGVQSCANIVLCGEQTHISNLCVEGGRPRAAVNHPYIYERLLPSNITYLRRTPRCASHVVTLRTMQTATFKTGLRSESSTNREPWLQR